MALYTEKDFDSEFRGTSMLQIVYMSSGVCLFNVSIERERDKIKYIKDAFWTKRYNFSVTELAAAEMFCFIQGRVWNMFWQPSFDSNNVFKPLQSGAILKISAKVTCVTVIGFRFQMIYASP